MTKNHHSERVWRFGVLTILGALLSAHPAPGYSVLTHEEDHRFGVDDISPCC